MKALHLILLFLLSTNISHKLLAQANSQARQTHSQAAPKIYLGFGAGYGFTNRILGAHLAFIDKSTWGITLAFRNNARLDAQNLPGSYDPGLCFFNSCRPKDLTNTAAISLVKLFPIANSSGNIGIELGPSINFYREAMFSSNSSRGLFGGNYTLTYAEQTHVGLPIRVSGSFPFASAFAFQVAALANLNKANPFFGFEAYLLIGAVRN